MRRFLLIALGIILTTLLSAQPANTFFSTFDAERGNTLAPARDGNLWLGGMKDERVLLTKLSPSGQVLDKHSMGFQGIGLDNENLVAFFEDTDGTLVGCGNFENDNSGRAFAFRYDPATRKTQWAHIVRSGDLTYLFGIAPLGPGGDYVLYGNPHFAGGNDAELLRLRRNTGQIVAGKAKRIGIGTSDNISQTVYHNGALYACGRMTNDGAAGFSNLSKMRNALYKLDTATLQPVWTRIGPFPSSASARLYGRDLIIDNEAIISTFSGDATGPDLFSSTIFLQKNDLAGNLLWAKQYDLPDFNGEFAEEVIALPDGYMLYGHDLLSDFSRLFLLKTDKQGDPVSALKIDFDANEEFSEIPARSKILRLGDALFLTALSQNNLGQTQGILAKTDLDGWVSDSCGFFQKTPVQLVATPAPVSEAVVPATVASPATLTSAIVSHTTPDLVFSKKCGATGTCPSLPDIRLTLDSMPCRNGVPLLYFTLCNVGGQPYDGGLWIQLFDKNPLTDTARALTSFIGNTNQPFLPGDCSGGFSAFSSDLLPSNAFELDTFPVLYALMGTNFLVQTPIPLSGFPYSPNEPECNYLNNLDSLIVPPQVCGDCAAPSTFVKILGSPTEPELAFSMCPAADGNVYIAGRQGNDPMIAKITPLGEPIWVRNFPGSAIFPTELSEIIEDSDQMLVLCGTEGTTPSNRHAVAMRYDPVADQVLWAQQYPAGRPVASGILEKSPGGNFLLSSSSAEFSQVTSELRELDRATGEVLPALAVRYLGEPNLRINDMAMSNGDLYAVGIWNAADGVQQLRLPILTKISATDGQPEWAFLTDPNPNATDQKSAGHSTLLIDGDILFISGNDASGAGSLLYLEKRRTDGSLIWMRRYNIVLFSQNVIRTENSIVVFGITSDNHWGMMKVDITTGDLIAAKTLDIPPLSNFFNSPANRKNRLIRIGLDLLMLDQTSDGIGGSDLLLLRTDTNFGLDDTCSLLRPAPISVVTRPAKSLPVTIKLGSVPTTAAAWPQALKSDSLAVSKLCPRCDCEGVPDVTFKVNRIACAADSSLEYRAEVCNLGLGALNAAFEVTFFDQNPLTQAAQAVWSTTVNAPLAPGQCKEMTWPLPAAASQYPQLYALVGVGSGATTPVSISGFPYSQSGVEECRYTNNLDSFVVKTPVCDGCENPTTFFKTMGRADQSEFGYSLCTSSDGNVYMAGRQGDNPMIAKMTPNGEMLWVRNFSSDDGPFDDIDLVEIIEDSEGQLVLCGTRNHSPNTRRAVVMRYDPVADQVLWFKQYAELYPEVLGIFEKTPGGNFVIYAFSDEIFNNGGPIGGTYYRARSQVWELDRTTGDVVPGLATLYPGNPSTSVYFQDMVPHQGSLYCVGGWDDDNIPNSGRAMLAKLSPFDGAPEWIQGTLPDTVVQFRFFNWSNVLVDNDQLVVLGNGLTDINLPNQRTFVFLSKYTLDGTLLWIKSYDAGIGGADIAALPDGYVIFGRALGNAFGLIKVDKDGNLLKAQKIAPPATAPAYSFYRKHRLLRLPNHLLMVDDFRAGIYNDLMLLKTDYGFNLDDSCSLLQPLPVIVETRSAKANPISVAFGPYGVKAVDQTTVFQADSLNVRQLCPQCPCVDKPDLTFRADSIYCTPDGGAAVVFQACNEGQVATPAGFNLTFYDKNPLEAAALPLYSTFVTAQPGFGDCVAYTLVLDTALLKYPKLYTLAGLWKDVQTPITLSDFPFSGGYAECDYANNLDSFDLNISTSVPLNLGPDRNICQGQTVTLDAGSGYATYQWLGGPTTQTYTISTAGNYIAEVTDVCGRVQRDTVQVTVLPYLKRPETLVLLPGETVAIDGVVYTAPAVVLDTLPSLTGGCDTLATYTLVLDSLGCKEPSSFLKTYEDNIGRVVLTASDSSVYVAGENVNSTTLSKYDAFGRHIWSRSLLSGTPLIYIASLIEDSEGMLVGSGSVSGSALAVVFRYNPATNQMLWRRQVAMDFFGLAEEVLEEKAGGDFLLVHSQSYTGSPTATEIQRLSRATGELMADKAYRYEPAQMLEAKMSGGMLYAVGGFKDSTASNNSNSMAGLMKIDPTTGAVAWTRKVAGNNAIGAFDLVIDAAGDAVTLMGKYDEFWLQKTNPSGQLIWLRKYTPLNAADGSPYPTSIELSKDGNYIVSLIASSTMGQVFVVVKIDKDGAVIWGRQIPGVIIPGNIRPQLLGTSNDDIFFTYGGYTLTSTLFGKFDRNGNMGDNCGAVRDFAFKFSPLNLQLAPVAPKFSNRPRTNLALPYAQPLALNLAPLTRCAQCEVPCDSVAITKTITFYPGDTITIDGVAYTQSATVVQNFTTSAGCDSMVTNILQLVITEVNITCPANLTVTLPPNQTSTVVDYSLPAVTTNCPDSTIKFTLLQGLPVGGSFPQGTTLVCYEAANQCGIRDTCCFTVTAELPDSPCDVKAPAGCIRYDLLSIRLDSIGQRRYRVRMTNTCPSPLEFAYIQLPNGVLAVAPANNATYTAPGGNAYAVRNPNASPFYSVRYKAVVENLNNGESDIFEYTLPQQSAPTYIRAASRLADGTYSEAHLNTYNCPEVMENLELRMENEMPAQFSILNSQLSVRPNPTEGLLFVDVSGWQGQSFHLQVLNAQGQTVVAQQVWAENGLLELALPANVVNGLYYLRVVEMVSGQRPSPAAAVRFVVER